MTANSSAFFDEIELNSIERLLLCWQENFPHMGVFMLVPEAEHLAVAALQALCKKLQIPMCGAIFPQLIHDNRFLPRGLCLLRFDQMPYAALYSEIDDNKVGAANTAERIAADIASRLDDDIEVSLFLVLDGLLPNISTLLDELYLRLANRVHYVGVNAGSERFCPMPCVFDQQQSVERAALVMLLKPHQGAVLEHGYRHDQHSLPATSTDNNRIIHINWRPAFEVYQELVKNRFGVDITRDNFYHYAVHFPFGILRANHRIVVRIPVMLDDDNALYCIGEVPPHSMLTLLDAPEVDSGNTLHTLQQGLAHMSGDPSGRELLLFYCAGRRMHLGEPGATRELEHFSQISGAASIVGALALGEIGDTTLWGYPLFHNATLVTTTWVNPHAA